MTEPRWEGATFAGTEQALRERVAGWTPPERLAWLEQRLAEMHRDGLLEDVRRRRQEAADALWAAGPGQAASGARAP